MHLNKKSISRFFALLLAGILLVSGFSVFAAAEDAEFESQLSSLNAEKEAATAKRITAQNKVQQLKGEQAAIIEEKMALEERNIAAAFEISVLEQQIALIEAEIATYDQMIKDKEAEVIEAENRENVQLEKYRTRVRAMEENGDTGILTILLNSESFPEMLTAIDDYKEIMESDVDLYDQLQLAREEHQRIRAEYLEYQAQCEEVKAGYYDHKGIIEAERDELEKQIADSEKVIAEYEEKIREAEKEQAAMEAAEAAASQNAANFTQQYYARKQAEQAAQQAALAAAQQAVAEAQTPEEQAAAQQIVDQVVASAPAAGAEVTGTGSFAWPFPGHTIITSPFGNRASTGSFHTGVDIDGFQSGGSPIVAADSGTVIRAEYAGGYGNCIIIDHGNGLSTLYAHLSSMNVGLGSTVSKGQTLGGVGNTGTCYGADGIHLHFEVMVNGTQVDPLGYLGGYPYSFY